MRRIAAALLALLLFAVAGCSSSSSTVEYCDEACTIWTNCTGWDFNACVAECTDEGDWDQDYLLCIQDQGCGNLLACE